MRFTKVRRRDVLGGVIHEYHRRAVRFVSAFWSPTPEKDRLDRNAETGDGA
jgi:hypothetical protein